MDFIDLLRQHIDSGADITLGTTPVDRKAASAFGIMHSDANRRIFRFEEKPKDPKLLDELIIPAPLLKDLGLSPDAELYQGSMGIYVFNRENLLNALEKNMDDFGKHILPQALQKRKGMAYIFQKYCAYIRTTRAFFQAQ